MRDHQHTTEQGKQRGVSNSLSISYPPGTYSEVPHVLCQTGGQDIEEAVHAQVTKFGEGDEVIVLGEQASEENAEQGAKQEDEGVPALPRLVRVVVVNYLDLLAGPGRAVFGLLVDGCHGSGRGRRGGVGGRGRFY